jgi:hypothetical protein
MDFTPSEKLDDIATGLGALMAAADELANDPPACFQHQTIAALTHALTEVRRVVAELEEQRETATG